MKYICALFAACICTLVVAPASAQEWSDSLPPEAVETYIPSDTDRVVVVPAGENQDETKTVASALTSVIDGLDARTAVTVPGIARGVEDDDAILERADSLAADAVLIVRIFASDDAPPTAVGTFYTKDGTAFSAFALEKGETLARREHTRSPPKSKVDAKDESDESADENTAPSEGVTPDTSDAVESVNEQNEASYETRLTSLESRILRVSELKLINGDGSSESRLTFYKGIHHREITPEEFFTELDRPGLAKQYRRNKRIRTWTSIGSVTGLLSGAVMLTYGATKECNAFSAAECDRHQRNMNVVMISGATVLVGGVVGLIILEATSPLPVDPAEARELAYEHNVELAEELGVPEKAQPFSEDKRALEVDFGLGPMGDGAGAAIYGRF
ncbi:MAG: hypothetical protein ACQEVA_16375 [Myxococcota bacterium]